MTKISRRKALQQLAAVGGALMWPRVITGQGGPITVAGQPVEIAVWSLSPITVRIQMRPIVNGATGSVAFTGALADPDGGTQRARSRVASGVNRVR
ncbi:MAG: hypothetical protein WEE89_17550, partial [Gemmatimonadota bacterium]